MSDASAQIDPVPGWLDEARAMHGLPPGEKIVPAPPDSSDPAVIKAAQRAARLDARKLSATVHGMMESPEVRTWMYRLLENCRAFTSHDFPFGQTIDSLGLARNAAHREVTQFLTADILASCPDLYVLMLRENSDV
jgi:hypothetical protein